jgi:hypothetical protein
MPARLNDTISHTQPRNNMIQAASLSFPKGVFQDTDIILNLKSISRLQLPARVSAKPLHGFLIKASPSRYHLPRAPPPTHHVACHPHRQCRSQCSPQCSYCNTNICNITCSRQGQVYVYRLKELESHVPKRCRPYKPSSSRRIGRWPLLA